MNKFMDICKKNTMVSKTHMCYLENIIDELNNNNIEGSIVECGVWKGGCVMWMIHCQQKTKQDRAIYLYDTFDGMTFPTNNKNGDVAKQTWLKTNENKYHRDYDKWHGQNKWAYCPLDIVKNNIESTKYNQKLIKYVIGDVCQTLNNPTNLPQKIAILRLDTDFYESTKKELDVLFHKVVNGGYIIIDDYYSWKGSKVATDEFLAIHCNDVQLIDEKLTGRIKTFKKN